MSILRTPQSGHNDPLHHVGTFNLARGDATSDGDANPELAEKRRKQAQNARELQAQMRQNQERRERDRILEQRRLEKEEAELNNYNPFGRGGGGAPLRTVEGDLMANLREATREALGEPTREAPPAVRDLLERTNPGANPYATGPPSAGRGAPFMTPLPAHQTPRASGAPGGPPAVPSPTRQGLTSMYGGGPDQAYEKQMRQRKYVSELEEQMRNNQDRRQKEAAAAAALDAKIEASVGFSDQWGPPSLVAQGQGGRGAPDGAPTRFAPPPIPPMSMQAANGGGGGGGGGGYGGGYGLPGAERITASWDGAVAGLGVPGSLPPIAEDAHEAARPRSGGAGGARYAEPIVRGASREEQLARMLEWERDRARELDLERRRERERERERDAARQRDADRAAERQREWEQRLHVEENERRQREERRLGEEIAAMRRDFLNQQRQIMSQVEEQLARMRAAALGYGAAAAAAAPPAAPAAGGMAVRSTLLYADGSVEAGPPPLSGEVSPPPPPRSLLGPGSRGDAAAPGAPPATAGGGGSGGGGGGGGGRAFLTAGMGVASDDAEREPEEIDRLLQEFLGEGE